jgi:hypothetical protein
LTTLIATSVVRGSQQGESHGGIFLLDLEKKRVRQDIGWDSTNIDWQGRGWDLGLRGIAFDGERIFIAASDELFVYNKKFEQITSYKNPFLRHCHEISVYERRLYLTSTGFDSILGFDLDNNRFSWGLSVSKDKKGLRALPFNPGSVHGPEERNELHLNNVFCQSRGMYISGLRSGGLHVYTGSHLNQVATLPEGTHNARIFQNGILFNDTQKNVVRFVPASGSQKVFAVPVYNPELLTFTDMDDSRVARQGFGRGLCTIGESLIAAGSSPSTITLYDLETMKTTLSVNLSMDIRNAIHSLEIWPFDELPD